MEEVYFDEEMREARPDPYSLDPYSLLFLEARPDPYSFSSLGLMPLLAKIAG